MSAEEYLSYAMMEGKGDAQLLGFPPPGAFLLSGVPASLLRENEQGYCTDPPPASASEARSSISVHTEVYPGDHQFQVAIINKK